MRLDDHDVNTDFERLTSNPEPGKRFPPRPENVVFIAAWPDGGVVAASCPECDFRDYMAAYSGRNSYYQCPCGHEMILTIGDIWGLRRKP